MGIESFNWKSLFINEEGNDDQPNNEATKTPSFPPTNKFPEIELNSNVSNNSSNPF